MPEGNRARTERSRERRDLPCPGCCVVTPHRLYQSHVGYELARDRLDYTAWVCTRCAAETRIPEVVPDLANTANRGA